MFVYILTTVRGEDYEGYRISYQRVFKTLRGAKEELLKRYEIDMEEMKQGYFRDTLTTKIDETEYRISGGCDYCDGFIDKKKLGE